MSEEKFKILIVDDEKINISELSRILWPEYDVLAAKNGETALEVAQNSNPDLILLDVIMPDMSGFDVIIRLKNSDFTRDIPVIFITGLDSRQDEEKGLLLGAVDYITKPFHNSIVNLRVKTQLKIIGHMRTIEQLGMMDTLTGLPNRRNFDQQLNIEWKRAARENMPLSLMMLDIDKFKVLNDTYGHACGDEVLKTVAQVILQTLKRATDFAARWGGEEFSVLLPNTGLVGALEVAEQIRANVESMVTPFADGSSAKITISIGVNSKTPNGDSSLEHFISGADKALYTAKDEGRNAVRSV